MLAIDLRRFVPIVLSGLFIAHAAATPPASAQQDNAYRQRFIEKYPPVAHPPTLAQYASVERYDHLYMGDSLDKSIRAIKDDGGLLAWGTSYQMQSLNRMFLNTGDVKYLAANLRIGQAVLAVRDDKTGMRAWNGKSLPAWSSPGYSSRGRCVFLVHTGMIVYPLLDAIRLERGDRTCPPELRAGLEAMLQPLLEAVHVHDSAWREGPGKGEGYYIGLGEEPFMDNRPQPVNRLSGFGRALWIAYGLTKDTTFRDRALAIGRYIKHRLPIADDGGYYWAYWLSVAPATQPVTRLQINGEDASHAALSMSFPVMLAGAGKIFTTEDMRRFGIMFQNGISRLGDGIMLADVTGKSSDDPARIGSPAKYLCLRPWCPQVVDRIVTFYLKYKPTPTPLELSSLIALTKSPATTPPG